ncbi:MAG TPA: DegT/DnrJ/EryC1/StrS family aminotransferase, partial [Vicinamibacterales bacterium]
MNTDEAVLAVDGGVPVRATFLPFHQPTLDADDEQAVLEVLRSGWITTGPRTKAFERALARYTGAARCVAVNSCTAALHLALEAIGVGPGDEVITSPITFASTANVIVHRGARPVFADVDADTLNLDPAALEAAITPRTKAIVPVDFAGQPCELDAIMAIARGRGLVVIEDAAHAIGAELDGRRIGSIADMTAFSFYATKNITSGEGGALTTDREEWAERIQIMALHGISKDAWKR